jgi:hypothetical protein
VHQHFPNRTSLSAKNRYSILKRKQEGTASGSASPQHARTNTGSSSSYSPPTYSSTSLSPNPYLGVAATPSTTAFPTPESDFSPADWMAFSGTGTDELLQQSLTPVAGADGWYQHDGLAVSTDLSRQTGQDSNLEPSNWTTADWTAAISSTAWPTPSFETSSGAGDSQLQLQMNFASTAGYEVAGYPTQGQPATAPWYGYEDALGLCQPDGHERVINQEMYGSGNALGGQAGMNDWDGAYSTGTW